MTTKKNPSLKTRLLQWLQLDIRHKRLNLFWWVALIGIGLPWLPSCEHTVREACTLDRVSDGDTVRLICNGEPVKVRLYCIDAPEMKQGAWGRKSRDYLKAITPQEVMLIARDKDRYGRTVGEVITTGEDTENLNLAMVWAGRAAVYPKYCDERQYYQAQRGAQKNSSGIWETLGAHQHPWTERR